MSNIARRAFLPLSVSLLAAFAADGRAGNHEPEARVETVVLLHGLGRTYRSMNPLARYLEDEGFDVHNLRYESTEKDPDALVQDIAAQVNECCTEAYVLHFVGHSLGAILVRAYIEQAAPRNLGRVVMLAPPNHGSEIVDEVGDWKVFEALMGPTAQQLGTEAGSLPNRLPPPGYEVGVIAGTGTVNPIGSIIIPDEDDGMVSVESTKLDHMTDFLLLERSHAFIMRSDEIGAQVVHFLQNGTFAHED